MDFLDNSVDIVVCILDGQKKNAPLYSDIKKFCHEKGVPVQVVLCKTIENGKGLRSICNKILTQMCAKVGGIPWTMSEMPFSNQPTMLMGIDMYQKISNSRSKYVTGISATTDRYFALYDNHQNITRDITAAHSSVYAMAKQTINNFKTINNVFPKNIIVYREGTSAGQIKTILENELVGTKDEAKGIKKVIEELQTNSKLIIISVNKKINSKVFMGDSLRLSNPETGTLVTESIVEKDSFLLISQKSNQGISAPVKYQIIYNDYSNE